MFATLDPTVRQLTLPSRRRALLGDTVGFIRNLPTTLVKAFRATLEEVGEASLILHVVDVTSPHAVEQTAHVLEVLVEIGAAHNPQLLVLNKIDRLPPGEADVEILRNRMLSGSGHAPDILAAGVSALTGQGLPELLGLIDKVLPFDPLVRARFRFRASDGASIHLLHEFGRVISTRYEDDECIIEAETPESLRNRLAGAQTGEDRPRDRGLR
jgi:GTP-binding protein HflX